MTICPSFGNHRIQRNDTRRILVVDSHALRFSAKQYEALVLLVQGNVVADTELVRAVYSEELYADGSKNLEKLIRKIREQLYPVGLTIERMAKRAYILLAIPD